jgi:hypothetical protein
MAKTGGRRPTARSNGGLVGDLSGVGLESSSVLHQQLWQKLEQNLNGKLQSLHLCCE